MATTVVRVPAADAVARLLERAREVVKYRKSGLSLKPIQGCPPGCAYCIRHAYGLWDADTPVALMSDAHAVERLVGHRCFGPHATPVQVFNRATNPLLPAVKPHLIAVPEDLGSRLLTNHVLVMATRKAATDAPVLF